MEFVLVAFDLTHTHTHTQNRRTILVAINFWQTKGEICRSSTAPVVLEKGGAVISQAHFAHRSQSWLINQNI